MFAKVTKLYFDPISITASPGEAVQALVEAVRAADMEALAAILGPEGRDLISSGDAVADKQDLARFVRSYEQSNTLERPTETKAVLVIGQDQWPLPIPVVKEGETWRFDSAAARGQALVHPRVSWLRVMRGLWSPQPRQAMYTMPLR